MIYLIRYARPIAIISILAFLGMMVANEVASIANKRYLNTLLTSLNIRSVHLSSQTMERAEAILYANQPHDDGGFGPYTPVPKNAAQ